PEPLRVGTQAVSSATDAAVVVLRSDDVSAARSGGGAGGAGGPKGGEGGEGGGDGEDFCGPPNAGAPGGPQWPRNRPETGMSACRVRSIDFSVGLTLTRACLR